MNHSKIRVLIVEDDPLIADDIRGHLSDADYSVIDIAYDKSDALRIMEKEVPDIALLDINLGNNMDGFEIAKTINDKYIFPFLYLTSHSTRAVVNEAKQTHPMGYIVKPFDENDLFTSIEIALYNFSQLHRPVNFTREAINGKMLTDVTAKEFEVLQDLYEGKTNKQMAEKHFVSVNTIKTHVQKIYEKLDTHTRSETIALVRSLLQ